jgi:hypothetical protein
LKIKKKKSGDSSIWITIFVIIIIKKKVKRTITTYERKNKHFKRMNKHTDKNNIRYENRFTQKDFLCRIAGAVRHAAGAGAA